MTRSKTILVPMLLLCLSFAGCPSSVTVPNVAAMTQQAANQAIVTAHLTLGAVTHQASPTIPAGCVISQNPSAGASASSGAAVSLVISTGPAPSIAWSYSPASSLIWGQSIDQAVDGGYIVSGGEGDDHMYALKLTAAGAKSWEYVYNNFTPDSNHTELWAYNSQAIRQLSNGKYLMLGAGHNYQDGYPGKSYLFVTLTTAGLVESSRVYSPVNPYSAGTFCSASQPAALELTSDGGYVAFGSSNCSPYLASIYKANSAGTMQYGKVINDNARDYEEIITDGEQTLDGGYILAGGTQNGYDHGYAAVLIKLNSAGTWQWSKVYQDEAGDHGAQAYAVTQTADGGYILAGNLLNSITKVINYGPWIAKVDSDGDEEWFNAYGSANTAQAVECVKETPDGDILAVGNMGGYLTLSKYSADGVLLWNYKMTTLTAATGKEFVLTADGGCVIVASGGTGGPTLIVKVNNVYIP